MSLIYWCRSPCRDCWLYAMHHHQQVVVCNAR